MIVQEKIRALYRRSDLTDTVPRESFDEIPRRFLGIETDSKLANFVPSASEYAIDTVGGVGDESMTESRRDAPDIPARVDVLCAPNRTNPDSERDRDQAGIVRRLL